MNDIVKFLFEESQVREALEGLPTELRELFSEAADDLKVEKQALKSALSKLKLELADFEVGEDAVKTSDESAYRNLLSALAQVDTIARLAELGWVATASGDTAAAAEVPEFQVKFVEVAVAADEPAGKDSVEDIIKRAVEFATTADLPKIGDKPDFKPAKGDTPGVGKPKSGTVPEAVEDLQDAVHQAVNEQRAVHKRHHQLSPDTTRHPKKQFGKMRRALNRHKTL